MAFRTWVKLLLATLGVAALAGAAQLGVAYGLGIVRLTRVLDVTTRDQWTAQLAWVTWFATVAAVIGALAGARLLPRFRPAGPVAITSGKTSYSFGFAPPPVSAGIAFALAFAAGIGAAIVVPLTMQPARTAQVAGVNPVVVIGICAGLGAVIGVFAAWAALTQMVARWSLTTLTLAVWIIALISVSSSLAPSGPLPAIRLGVFDASFLSTPMTQRTALFTLPAVALVAGAVLGWRARRLGLPTLTIGLAGLPGPAVLTLAYLVAGPGSGGDRYQVVPYWAAMTATGAGVLGSVLAAVLRNGPDDDEEAEEPTEGRPPLPRRGDEPVAASPTASSATASFDAETTAGSASGPDSPGSSPAGSTSSLPSFAPSFGPAAPNATGMGARPAESPDPRSTSTRMQAPTSSDPRSTSTRMQGPGSSDPRSTSTRMQSPAASDPRMQGPASSDPRMTGTRLQSAASSDPRMAGPRTTGTRMPAPRPAGSGPVSSGPAGGSAVSGSSADPRPTNAPRAVATDTADPRATNTRLSDPRATGTRMPAPRPAAEAMPRPLDTGVIDVPSGAVRSAPRNPLTKPWAPTPGAPSTPLGAPPAEAAEPETPISRRASAVEAFKARTSSWPSSRQSGRRGKQETPKQDSPKQETPKQENSVPLGDYAKPEPAAFDGFAPTDTKMTRPENLREPHGPQPLVPKSAARPTIPGAPSKHAAPMVIAQPDGGPAAARPAPKPATGRGGKRRSEPAEAPRGRGPSAYDAPPPVSRPTSPYVPEPATRPLPPEVLGAPLTPEPHAVSAPLPEPTPVTPPLAVTPAPEPEQKRRFGRKRKNNNDYVDWVSGLGDD